MDIHTTQHQQQVIAEDDWEETDSEEKLDAED